MKRHALTSHLRRLSVVTPFAAALLALAAGGALAQAPAAPAQNAQPVSAAAVESNARTLEQRLRAPCCRGQMLDAHESDVTRALRQELRTRLAGGEAVSSIEGDLVRRYGESIVSIRKDADPRGPLSWLLALLLSSSAGALAFFGLRWVRRSRAQDARLAAPGDTDRSQNDALDARIEAELKGLDA